MTVDRAGWRATRVAKVMVDAVWWLGIAGALYFAVLGGFGVGGFPEGLLFLVFGVMLLGIYWLRAFLRDVTAGNVFTPLNAQRLARIGWLLIATAVLRTLVPFLFGGIVAFYNVSMLLPMLLAALANGTLIAGLLLLVISAAWRYGTELQNERDLTV